MSSSYINAAATPRAPVKRGKPEQQVQRLAAAGGAEAYNMYALPLGVRASIIVGEEPVRVRFAGEGGMSNAVDNTDLLLPAGARLDWIVTSADCFVYTEGTQQHESWVWPSSNRV